MARQLRKLTAAEYERALERLRFPIPGGKVEAAIRFGVDVTLLAEQLKLSPAERVRRMLAVAETAQRVRGAARKA